MNASPDTPLVSIVTVCFNSDRYIAQTIESVLAQDFSDFEYIIVDGGSADGTLDTIRAYEDAFGGRLTWTSEPDEGIYDAMNRGIARARGRLIGLLNSDDRYAEGAVPSIVAAAENSPDAGLIYGDVRVIGEDGSVIGTETARDIAPGDRPDWLPMCHQSLFVSSEVYASTGAYDTRYRILADYEFVLRCLAAGVPTLYVPQVIAEFRTGGACNTNTLEANRERERIRVTYGANPFVERVRYLRHRFNIWAHGLVRDGRL